MNSLDAMPYPVDFTTVSTVGLESSPVADTLAGLRANEARYFKNKYDHVFTVEPADEAAELVDWVHRILKEERDIVIASRPLEATAFQTREVLDAVNADSGVELEELKVDGGMIANDTLMQFQADILGVPVIRPVVAETTALGAAYAAGLAVGFWSGLDDLRANWQEDRRWEPKMDAEERDRQLRLWKKAVTKTFDWVDDDVR